MPSTPKEGFDPRAESSVLENSIEAPEARPTPLSLFGLEFSLDTASLDSLEEVARAVDRARVSEWFSRFFGTEEVALLSTCHRVELVGLARFPDEVDRWREVLPGSRSSWRVRAGREVVTHLFRVASGRKSLALGEAEVRHQVRAAGSHVESRHPRPVLRTLFLEAARAAQEVTPAESAPRSIASIAAARLLELVSEPRPHVVVVGAGTVGRQVVENLAPYARLTVVFHRWPPDEEFLRAAGAQAVGLDRLQEAIAVSDAVVTAAKFGNHGLHVFDLPRDRPLVLVDLGLPRNIEPAVRQLSNVRLVDLEELHSLPESWASSDGCDGSVDELADRFSERLDRLLLEPWVEAFRRAAEEVRRSELANARPFLGNLNAAQEHAIDLLTQRLVTRLLRSPTERLRSLPAGPEGDRQRRAALDLLKPDSTDP